MKKGCFIINFWSGDRTEGKADSGFGLRLLKYIWKTAIEVEGNYPFDTIIVNNEGGTDECNKMLSEISGKKTKNGKCIVLNKENRGFSFAAYNYTFEKFRKEYHYWVFNEDDVLFDVENWYGDLVNQYEEIGKNNIWIATCGIGYVGRPNEHAHGGIGLTSIEELNTMHKTNGCLIDRDFDSQRGGRTEGIGSEIQFGANAIRSGIEFVVAPKRYYSRWFTYCADDVALWGAPILHRDGQ